MKGSGKREGKISTLFREILVCLPASSERLNGISADAIFISFDLFTSVAKIDGIQHEVSFNFKNCTLSERFEKKTTICLRNLIFWHKFATETKWAAKFFVDKGRTKCYCCFPTIHTVSSIEQHNIIFILIISFPTFPFSGSIKFNMGMFVNFSALSWNPIRAFSLGMRERNC